MILILEAQFEDDLLNRIIPAIFGTVFMSVNKAVVKIFEKRTNFMKFYCHIIFSYD